MTTQTVTKGRAKPRKYPVEDLGGFRIRYIDPAKIKPRKGSKAKTRHITPFWQVDNRRRGADRKRFSFETLEAAKTFINAKSPQVKNEGQAALALTASQQKEAAKAIKGLDGKATLADMRRFWEQHHPSGEGATLKAMFDKWIAWQEDEGFMPTSIRQNRQRVGVFVREMKEDTPCSIITQEQAKAFIASRKCGPVTRDSWRKTLRAFFSYCVEKKATEINPVPEKEKADRKRRLLRGVKGKAKEVQVKKPAFMDANTVERFMLKAEELCPESVPAFAVMFFAGLRPFSVSGQYDIEPRELTEARDAVANGKKWLEETNRRGGRGQVAAQEKLAEAQEKLKELLNGERKKRGNQTALIGGLDWASVKLADPPPFIRVEAETDKTGVGRTVQVSDNLLAWLTKYYKATGPVSPAPPTLKRHRQEVMKAIKLGKWLPDIARHTFASMHLAKHQNRELLAAQMGHSEKSTVLEANYRGLAEKSEAEKFWNIKPAGTTDGQTLQLATATKGA